MAEKKHKEISLKKFLSTFTEIHTTDKDRKFCFVLGAGASVSSGIPTGATLATKWLNEIEANEEPELYEKWLKDSSIDSKNPAISYPKIYQKRYEDDPKSGFSFIESLMASKTPSYGYSVLAQILATTRHNVVITTNFDDLLQEALYTYTDKRPLVCGHESLAGFAKAKIERPLIIKIHRDRFLSPINDNQIEEMKEQWLHPLSSIFSSYTPIFIGYGGNDGSLMDFLKDVREFENIFWIEREGKSKILPNETVLKLLANKDGKLVFSQGFDDLMFLLQDKMGLALLDDDIIKVANTRKEKYQKEVEEILKRKSKSGTKDEKVIAGELFEKAEERGWWYYELKAKAARTLHDKQKIYIDGIEKLPNSEEMACVYALFLKNELEKYDEAEKYFKKAIQLAPNIARNYLNYASFLQRIKSDSKLIHENYKTAIKLAPEEGHAYAAYASFLYSVGNSNLSQEYFIKALQLSPDNAIVHSTYAVFLYEQKQDYKNCKIHLLKSIELNSFNPISLANYAEYLRDIEKDYEGAKDYYQRSLLLEYSKKRESEYHKLLELMKPKKPVKKTVSKKAPAKKQGPKKK